MIVLGGGVTQIGSLLIDPALRIVQERAMEVPSRDARIVLTSLGGDVGIIGAGALNFLSGCLAQGFLSSFRRACHLLNKYHLAILSLIYCPKVAPEC